MNDDDDDDDKMSAILVFSIYVIISHKRLTHCAKLCTVCCEWLWIVTDDSLFTEPGCPLSTAGV